MAIGAAYGESDRADAQASSLDLDTREARSFVDDGVVPCVLAERKKHRVPHGSEGEQNG